MFNWGRGFTVVSTKHWNNFLKYPKMPNQSNLSGITESPYNLTLDKIHANAAEGDSFVASFVSYQIGRICNCIYIN